MGDPLPRAMVFLAGLLENGSPAERDAAKVLLPVCRAARTYVRMLHLPDSQAGWLPAALEELRIATQRVGIVHGLANPVVPPAIATLADMQERTTELGARRALGNVHNVWSSASRFLSDPESKDAPIEVANGGLWLSDLRRSVADMEAR
jgi:hypothetical protein